MSRSYKRSPYCGDRKRNKRRASKKVRREYSDNDYVVQYGGYKKLYESWEICDYWFRCSWVEYWLRELEIWNNWDKFRGVPMPNKEQAYKRWCKWYKRK